MKKKPKNKKKSKTSNTNVDLHKLSLEKMPIIQAEIDQLVLNIANRISRLPPDKLMQKSWWNFAACSIENTEYETNQKITSMRMIDYVQSMIAAVKPNDNYAIDVSDEEWDLLRDDVSQLFMKINHYQLYKHTGANTQSTEQDIEISSFQFRRESFWMNVRGKRFAPHESSALLDLLSPHSRILVDLFGIDASTLVQELGKILTTLTHNGISVFEHYRDFLLEAAPYISHESNNDLILDLEKLPEDLLIKYENVAGVLFGLDLFDVEKNTNLSKSLLAELAWSPGEEKEFLYPGEFCGWPLRIWPTMQRPFLKISGRFLCFDIFSLFDNIYRVLQRIVYRLAPAYKTIWNERQKEISEKLPFTYLKRILPNSLEYRSIYYQVKINGKMQWCETDGILIYDDHLFIVEVKAGAFTYTSPTTDLSAHINSIENLVVIPTQQGRRFLEYLESTEEVIIYDKDKIEITTLRHDSFRQKTICAITVDSFTELAARAEHLKRINIDVGERSTWVLSIDDLRVYSDIIKNPLIFLHFVEQRMKAAKTPIVDLMDEMDHLSLYLINNMYSMFIEQEAIAHGADFIHMGGFRTIIDEYYESIVYGETPVPPGQKMPEQITEIINFLAESQKTNRSKLASFLLDASNSYRITIADAINTLLNENVLSKKVKFFSTDGSHGFTQRNSGS